MRPLTLERPEAPSTCALAQVGQSVPIIDSCQRGGLAGAAGGSSAPGGDLPGGPGAEWCELVEAVEAGDQQACVDGASGRGGHVDLGDHRHPGDVSNVARREAAARLPHHDDAIGWRSADSREGAQGEVAGPRTTAREMPLSVGAGS
jgi:hypothetical protein